jgi:hypothetical protein
MSYTVQHAPKHFQGSVYLLSTNKLPAQKIGAMWIGNRAKLRVRLLGALRMGRYDDRIRALGGNKRGKRPRADIRQLAGLPRSAPRLGRYGAVADVSAHRICPRRVAL